MEGKGGIEKAVLTLPGDLCSIASLRIQTPECVACSGGGTGVLVGCTVFFQQPYLQRERRITSSLNIFTKVLSLEGGKQFNFYHGNPVFETSF